MSVTAKASRVQQIGEALVLLLDVADAGDEFLETINAKRVWTTQRELTEVGESLFTLVAPHMTTRARTSNGTYRRDVVFSILARAHLSNDVGDDSTLMDIRVYLSELIDKYLADPANSELTLTAGVIAQYIEPTDERAESDMKDGLGVLWVAEDLDEKRQQTVLVRVAYWVDEDY